MRALQGHPGQDVSSTVTKRNPRPRKYASASERQAAYRARAPEVCFRAEGKTVDTLDKIAADLDVSRADLLLSMTKFALTNHDWGRFGLTHRPLPYQYGVEQEARTNPAPIWDRPRPKKLGPSVPLTAAQKRKAKALAAAAGRSYPNLVDNIAATRNPMKKPTPAQIAARERFAEMARSGAFKRKASKRRKNPITETLIYGLPAGETRDYMEELLYDGGLKLTEAQIQKVFDAASAAGYHSFRVTGFDPTMKPDFAKAVRVGRKRNPAKKTVSQKISQLVHEGYPQKQAVAVALSEQRAGKVKRNPAPMIRVGDYVRSYDFPGVRDDHYLEGVVTELRPHTYVIDVTRRVVEGVEKRIPASLKQVEAPRGKGMFSNVYGVQKIAQRNPATGHKGSRTKLNPMAAPARSASASNYKYSVEAKRLVPGGSVFEPLGGFQTKTQAQDYAKAILASHPSVTLRIKTYK